MRVFIFTTALGLLFFSRSCFSMNERSSLSLKERCTTMRNVLSTRRRQRKRVKRYRSKSLNSYFTRPFWRLYQVEGIDGLRTVYKKRT